MKNGLQQILESRQAPGILGTRDSFGIGKEFRDESTGKTVDNWKTWERLGYKQFKDTASFKDKRGDIKSKVAEKLDKKEWKIRRQDA